MTAPGWARRCLAFGAAVLVVTVLLSIWSPRAGCGDLAPSTPPIIAFELATSASALQAVFGPPGACRAALVADFRIVNLGDYVFMATYGGFLVCAIAALREGARTTVLMVGLIASVAAPLADAIENIPLLAMDVDAPGAWLALLMVATRAKFALLAVVSATIAIATLRRESGRVRLLAILHVPAVLVTPVALFSARGAPALLPAMTLSWIAASVWAGIRSVRPNPLPAPG